MMNSLEASAFLKTLGVPVSRAQVLNLIRHGRLRAKRMGNTILSAYEIEEVELYRLSLLRELSHNSLEENTRDIVWVHTAAKVLDASVDWSNIRRERRRQDCKGVVASRILSTHSGAVLAALLCVPRGLCFDVSDVSVLSDPTFYQGNSLYDVVIHDFFDKRLVQPLQEAGIETLCLCCTTDAYPTYYVEIFNGRVYFPWTEGSENI